MPMNPSGTGGFIGSFPVYDCQVFHQISPRHFSADKLIPLIKDMRWDG